MDFMAESYLICASMFMAERTIAAVPPRLLHIFFLYRQPLGNVTASFDHGHPMAGTSERWLVSGFVEVAISS